MCKIFGNPCLIKPEVFCQERSGCAGCQINIDKLFIEKLPKEKMIEIPLNVEKLDDYSRDELTSAEIDRQDKVDNACQNLLEELYGGDEEIEWNMDHIAEIRELAQGILVHGLGLMTEQEFYPFRELVPAWKKCQYHFSPQGGVGRCRMDYSTCSAEIHGTYCSIPYDEGRV